MILSTPEGFIYDHRVVSERYVDENNRDVVDLVSEEEYYRWMLTHERPEPKTWATHLVWIDG